jgi:hypothetical protein
MKSEIWEKFVGLTQSAQAKSFGRTRFALGIVFLAASQEGSTLTKHGAARAGQPVFLYRPSSLAVGKTGSSASPDLCGGAAPVGVAPFLPFLPVSSGRARHAQSGN